MDYQKHYESLISSRRNRIRIKEKYYELHHIIPRSMGGDDSESNLIFLTGREHFLAHWLLWRIHRNRQTAFAFHSMCHWKNKKTQGKERISSSRAYSEAREAYVKELSIFQSGKKKKKVQKRSPMSEKTKSKISAIKKGKKLGSISVHRSEKLKSFFKEKWKDKREERECKVCGSSFNVTNVSFNQLCCSRDCANKYKPYRIPVKVKNMTTGEIQEFPSIRKASEVLNISPCQLKLKSKNFEIIDAIN